MGAVAERVRVFEGYLEARQPGDEAARDAVLVRSPGPPPEAVRSWRLGEVHACLFVGGAIDVVPYRWKPRPVPEVTGVVLGHVIEGAIEITQHRRTNRLEVGEMLFYEPGEPFGLHADGPHRYLVARIPSQALGLRQEDRSIVAGRKLSEYGGAAALGALLSSIVHLPDDPSAGVGHHLGGAIVACAQAVIAQARGTRAGDRSTILFGELIDWLDAHLAGPEATTEGLAAAHFLSARYVRKLFADHGATVSAYVRRRRLERIRDDLLQPWAAHLPVAAVAARWGFREPSVFSRAFTKEFGQGPQDFRRRAAGAG